jgi:glutamate dehydrogenase/leucine dehydrogenase
LKKTYALKVEGKHPDRLLEAIKHEIKKYIARERRKPLPKGSDFWDFDCKFGSGAATAEEIHVGAINTRINEYVAGGAEEFYLEVLAKPAAHAPRVQVVSYGDEDSSDKA